MSQLFKPSIEEQIACVERELRYRRVVYPRQVEAKKITAERSAREIETMEEVLATLQWIKRGAKHATT